MIWHWNAYQSVRHFFTCPNASRNCVSTVWPSRVGSFVVESIIQWWQHVWRFESRKKTIQIIKAIMMMMMRATLISAWKALHVWELMDGWMGIDGLADWLVCSPYDNFYNSIQSYVRCPPDGRSASRMSVWPFIEWQRWEPFENRF